MNVPDDLQLTDDQGRPRKNGEERQAINAIHDYLRSLDQQRGYVGTFHGVPVDDPEAPMKVVFPEWSNASRRTDAPDYAEVTAGTIDEDFFGPDSPNVRVMEKWRTTSGETRGTWMTIRREEAKARAMVAEDEAPGE